jgi:hypothetical protein
MKVKKEKNPIVTTHNGQAFRLNELVQICE